MTHCHACKIALPPPPLTPLYVLIVSGLYLGFCSLPCLRSWTNGEEAPRRVREDTEAAPG